MSEQPRAPAESSPGEGEDLPAEAQPQDTAAARRARRKAKLALRIPDDEIARPEPEKVATKSVPDMLDQTQETAAAPPEQISPKRIISVGPPPPAPDTVVKVPSAPPTAKIDDADATQEHTAIGATVVDGLEADGDIPVDEDIPIESEPPPPPLPPMRARVQTIPSAPPPVNHTQPAPLPKVPPAPKVPDIAAALAVASPPPSAEDALEIDEIEAAAVLSSRPPHRPSAPPPPPMPPPPAMPTISRPPVAPPSPSPLIPVDAMSSMPRLPDPSPASNPFQARLDSEPPRAKATALIDSQEAEPSPSPRDSGDEIDTTDLMSVEAKPKVDRPISAPPKPPPPTATPAGGIRALPPPLAKDKDKEKDKDKDKAASATMMMPIVAVVPSPLAPPALTESTAPRRRARPWWEDLFNDDFVKTMPKMTDAQIAAEVDFIEDSLGVAKGGSLLDLGCGTGLQAIELSRRGYAVVGFDLSLAMLARAGEEAQERNQKINFVQGDMREMTFDEAFDGVYCWSTSFGYFEEEKNAQVVSKVHRALRKGGQFLLDVANRDFIIHQAPSLAWFEGEGCVCMDEMAVDWITSRMRVKRTMMLDDGRSKEVEYSIRIYSLHELGKLLHDHGFRIAEVSGRTATPGVFFGPDSPRTLILAEKR